MDENNQNGLAGQTGQTPAGQALPLETPPAEPTVNQAPAAEIPPVENTPPRMPPPETPPVAPTETPAPEAPVEPAPGSEVPPGYDQAAPPLPPQSQPQQVVEPPVEPQMGEGGGTPVSETSVERPKKSIWGWIIGIVIILALGGGGYYYYVTKIKTSSSSNTSSLTTSTETSGPGTSPTPSSTSGSAIETAYNKAVAVTATANNAKTVDAVLAPILQKTFANKVKLTDASSMLTYVTNRQILAADVTSVKTELETAGYKAIDSAEKQMTMSKDTSTWVITFSVGSETKATIDVTY